MIGLGLNIRDKKAPFENGAFFLLMKSDYATTASLKNSAIVHFRIGLAISVAEV